MSISPLLLLAKSDRREEQRSRFRFERCSSLTLLSPAQPRSVVEPRPPLDDNGSYFLNLRSPLLGLLLLGCSRTGNFLPVALCSFGQEEGYLPKATR